MFEELEQSASDEIMFAQTIGSSNFQGTDVSQKNKLGTSVGRHRLWHLGSPLSWGLFDALLAFGCMLSAFSLTPAARSIATVPNHIARLPAAILFGATGFVLSYALGLSHYPNLRTRFRIVALVTLFVMIETLGILVIADFVYYKQIGRYILVYAGGLLWSVCIITRLLWYNNVKHAVHCIIVFGDNYVLGPLNSMLKRSTFPIRLLARPIAGVAQQDSNSFDGILNNRELHEVLVHGEKALHSDLLLAAMDRGITVSTFDSFSERHFFKIPSEFLSHAWFFQVDLRRQHPFYASI